MIWRSLSVSQRCIERVLQRRDPLVTQPFQAEVQSEMDLRAGPERRKDFRSSSSQGLTVGGIVHLPFVGRKDHVDVPSIRESNLRGVLLKRSKSDAARW